MSLAWLPQLYKRIWFYCTQMIHYPAENIKFQVAFATRSEMLVPLQFKELWLIPNMTKWSSVEDSS